MTDVTIENIEDVDVQNAGKYFAYITLEVLAGIVGIIIGNTTITLWK